MANFQNNAITESGILLRSHVDMGAIFTATKIVIGSGYIPSGKTAKTMTDVVSPVKELTINKKERSPDGKVVFGGVYTNEGVDTEFYFRELALYAKAVYPDGTEVEEVLYSYGNAAGSAELMAAYSTSTVVERQMDIVTFVGNEAKVDLTIQSGLYLSHAEKHAANGEDPITCEMIGAAPDGFGLGGFGVKVDNPNDIIANGFYVTNKNMPLDIFWFVKHHQYSTREYAWQFASTVANGNEVMAVRNKIGGVWEEWEWITPPFVNGFEYRTTERIGGKVVYKKNVNGSIQYRLDGETTWKEYATAVGAVSKTGDQTMSGSLTMRTLAVTDGYMNGSVSTDGSTSRVQILARNPNTGKAGAVLIGPNGIDFMDGDGYEYRVIHEGNIGQFLGVAPASLE